MIKAALYIRVSTEDQAKEGLSIETQEAKLSAFCGIKDWEVHDIYIDDGYTGRDVKRPGYKRMMGEIDKWDVLLVLRQERAHRHMINFSLMMDELSKKGKEFASATESFDTTTAMGRMFMDFMARWAQYFSEDLGEKTTEVMAHKAAARGPKTLGGQAPFGYAWNKKGEKVDPERPLVIVEEEAEVVRMIFGWDDKKEELMVQYEVSGHYSLIARTLDEKKIKPPKRAKKWSPMTVRNIILRRGFYEGKESSWGDVKGKPEDVKWEAIL